MIDLIQTISQFEELGSLEEWAKSKAKTSYLRADAFSALKDLRQYNDATEWSHVVRICELLAIIGWGDWEQLDAITSYNGDCWETKLINNRRETRLRHARWKKRKAGWLIFNPEYLRSDDFPDFDSEDWHAYVNVDFPTVAIDKLPSQRNPRQLMPFIFGMIGGANDLSDTISSLRNQMTKALYKHMRPEHYGKSLEEFYITFHTPFLDQDWNSGLSGGRYRAKQKDFMADLKIGTDLEFCGEQELRKWLSDQLLDAVSLFAKRISKKDPAYMVEDFISDVESAMIWFRGTSEDTNLSTSGFSTTH